MAAMSLASFARTTGCLMSLPPKTCRGEAARGCVSEEVGVCGGVGGGCVGEWVSG